VQLVTIHASKGLEYPVVYLPAVSDRHVSEPDLPRFHDDAGRRCRNVGAGGTGWADHVRRAQEEDAGEWLRLLYVALTRAQSQVVCWWSPTKNTLASPLHRMLMRAADSSEVPDQPQIPSDDDAVALFAQWRDRGGPAPELATPPGLDKRAPVVEVPVLGVRSFTRTVDAAWRRTSYSSLSAVRLETVVDAVTSEPEVVGKDDEQVAPDGLVTVPARPSGPAHGAEVASPMANLPVGATFGSLVHAVLEHADPSASDFRAELLGHIDEQRGWWPVELDREELADALVAVCDSPLGGPDGPLGGVTLRGVPLTDRLREMDFELPLAGGDVRDRTAEIRPGIRLGDLAPLLERHLPDGDPVRAYAVPLRGPLGEQALRGYLTGSVDVVLRVPTADGPRFHVVDYKTNWLGPLDEPLTAAAYRPAAMDAAMGHSDYPLQALLYAAVLHRFLRWRLPGYDPERHLGEVLYLYVRGMCGPHTPVVDGVPCGVFTWRAPVPLVEELSDLLAGRVVSR
jgi:exodeoxyribonuclease V beta subunit